MSKRLLTTVILIGCHSPARLDGSPPNGGVPDTTDAGATISAATSAKSAPAPVSLFRAIGRSCEELLPEPNIRVCQGGKLVGAYVRFDAMGEAPPEFHSLLSDKCADADATCRRASRSVRAEGTRLLVERVTCGNCEHIHGWGFLGDVSAMSDSDVKTLECRTRGRSTSSLHSIDAWQRTLQGEIWSSGICPGETIPFSER